MPIRMRQTLLWTGVLAAVVCLQAFFPALPAGPPAPGPPRGITEQDWPPMPRELERVAQWGCSMASGQPSLTKSGETGWRVVVWADYTEKKPGEEHDWKAWLSWRGGKKGREQAAKDCFEWQDKIAAASEKARKQKARKEGP